MQRDLLNVVGLVAGVLVLAIAGPLVIRQLRSLPPSLATRADQRIVTLEVSGMTCAGCATTLQRRLGEVAGVSTAAVRYPQRRAYVVCDRTLPDSTLIAEVRRAGPGFGAAVTVR